MVPELIYKTTCFGQILNSDEGNKMMGTTTRKPKITTIYGNKTIINQLSIERDVYDYMPIHTIKRLLSEVSLERGEVYNLLKITHNPNKYLA